MLCRWYIVTQGWVVVPHPLKNGVSCMICLFLPSTCKRRGREREKVGKSVAQWQQEKGRDWWNVKFSSAEETGLALLPVIGLAPFPKSKPTTLYCHFLFFSLSLPLALSLTHIHQFPIQSTQSPAVPFLAPSRSSMLVELFLSHHSLSLYPGKADTGDSCSIGSCSWTHKLRKKPIEWMNESRPCADPQLYCPHFNKRLNSCSISHFHNPFLKCCPTVLGSEILDSVECKQHLQTSTGLRDWLIVFRKCCNHYDITVWCHHYTMVFPLYFSVSKKYAWIFSHMVTAIVLLFLLSENGPALCVYCYRCSTLPRWQCPLSWWVAEQWFCSPQQDFGRKGWQGQQNENQLHLMSYSAFLFRGHDSIWF